MIADDDHRTATKNMVRPVVLAVILGVAFAGTLLGTVLIAYFAVEDPLPSTDYPLGLPASLDQVQPGDVIVEIDDSRLPSFVDLESVILSTDGEQPEITHEGQNSTDQFQPEDSPNDMQISFIVLTQDDFDAEYKKAFTPVDVPTEADKELLREAISTTQQLVVDALKSKWTEPDDFEVGWDFNYCYHVCGGIYSDRIVCPEYLHAIVKALASAQTPGKWTYHTVCETENYDSEFFVRDGSVYLSNESEPEFRKKLGCNN